MGRKWQGRLPPFGSIKRLLWRVSPVACARVCGSGLEDREFSRALRLVREVTTDRRGGARLLRDALKRHTLSLDEQGGHDGQHRVKAEVLREHLLLHERVR
jgi:hypothetical protein